MAVFLNYFSYYRHAMLYHYWRVDTFINKKKLLKTMKWRVLCSTFLIIRCPATSKVTAFAELLLYPFFNHCKLSFKSFSSTRKIDSLKYQGFHALLIMKNEDN